MTDESKVSKAQQKAVNKYVKNNYDRIKRLPGITLYLCFSLLQVTYMPPPTIQ